MTVSISPVYTGAIPNDGTGDSIKTAFDKVNSSFSNLVSATNGVQSMINAPANIATIATGFISNLSVTNRVVGSINFYGTDTIYINGSPVATSAVGFTGGNVSLQANFQAVTSSTNSATGAVVITGGLGVGGNINTANNIVASGTITTNSVTDSGSPLSGAITTTGGMGIAKNAYIGQGLYVSGLASIGTTLGVSGDTVFSSSTASSGTSTGAVRVTGGVGISGALNVALTSRFSQDLNVLGNLTVSGNVNTGSQTLSISSNFINLHSFSNGAPLTYDDGQDIGTVFKYYKAGSGQNYAFLGWANDSQNIEYYYTGSLSGVDFVGSYGGFKGGSFTAVNTTPSTSTTTGALIVGGGAGIAGNVNIGGNAAITGTATVGGSLTVSSGGITVTAGGITATAGNVTTGNVIATTHYGNSIGTTAVYTGNITAANIIANQYGNSVGTTAVYTGNITAGNINANMYSTVASVTGNITVSGIVAANYYFANGQPFVSSNYGNTQVLANLAAGVGSIIPLSGNAYSLGTSAKWWNSVYATTFTGTATTAQYADLAEIYAADAEYEPGTVVVFGGENEITVTDVSADVSVAGVVSTDPAYLMNSGAAGVPVALRGRVPVKVWGPVAKGDLLVTHTIPGTAISVGRDSSYGVAVFAKAIASKGTFEVDIIEAVIL